MDLLGGAVIPGDGANAAHPLVEVAPGAELERDIYPLMGFRPAVAADLKEMDPRIFRPEKMGLVLQD